MPIKIQNIDIETLAQEESKILDTSDYYVSGIEIHHLLRYCPIRYNCYMLALCVSGNIKVRVEGKEIHYNTNTLAVFTPSCTFEVLEASNDYRCRILLFKKSFIVETMNNIYFLERFKILNNTGLGYLRLDAGDAEMLEMQMKAIKNKSRDKTHPYRNAIVRNMIVILLYETENILINNDQNNYERDDHLGHDEVISKFNELLRKNFFRQRKVGFYADFLSVSPSKLTKMLQEHTGRSTKKHINEMVLSQAKTLLNSRRYNVTEIASLLHYDNIEEFSRFFKKETGVSPLKYRKKNTPQKTT